MGKHFSDCIGPCSNNRSANYPPNRSCENSARCRGYENEYAGRPFAPCAGNEADGRAYGSCCENERAERDSDCCMENERAERESGPCGGSERGAGYIQRSSAYGERSGESCGSCPVRLHLHEAQGSTQVAEGGCAAHSHRFACITSEPVLLKNGRHAHRLTFRTDTYDGHCHEFCGVTTENYEICGGHVHYCEGRTSESSGHCHQFKFITHIENPTGD